jgi:DNA-binding response OmpR family regulator
MSPETRVLLIEDDASFGGAVRRALELAGAACDHAPDAAAARRLFAQHHYHAVVADVHIPDDDGVQLVAEFQQTRRVPVIVMTGEPTLASTLAALRVPLVAFLTKPFEMTALLEALQRAVAAEKVFSSVAATRQRVDTWRSELAAFETLLPRAAAPATAAGTLLALNARHVMEAMAELRLQIAAFTTDAAPAASPAAVAALESSRPVVLLEAIRETIAVLDRTKDAFRSRELGELRRRLEALVSSGESAKR